MLVRKVAIWLLHDLRLHDHPALQAALADGAEALSFVYVWGPPPLGWGTFSYPALIRPLGACTPCENAF